MKWMKLKKISKITNLIIKILKIIVIRFWKIVKVIITILLIKLIINKFIIWGVKDSRKINCKINKKILFVLKNHKPPLLIIFNQILMKIYKVLIIIIIKNL